MRTNYLLYYIFLFLASLEVCIAQNNNFSKPHKTQSGLEVPLILLNLDSLHISEVKPILDRRNVFAVKFSNQEDINDTFFNLYKRYNDSLIVVSDKQFNQYANDRLHLEYIKPSTIETVEITQENVLDSILPKFKSVDKYTSVKLEDNVILSDSLFFKVWKQSGKLPNFIEPVTTSLKTLDSTVTSFKPKLQNIFGVVITEEGDLLNNVRFKGYENSIVNGYFSFPTSNRPAPILVPYKAGYYFSPDIIYVTGGNKNNIKKFTAYKLDLDYQLSDHYVFNSELVNITKNSNEGLLLNNVEIIKDSIKGNVGYFNKGSYIDTGIESKNSLRESFTISAWVKPTALGFNNSILGKGNNFVVKLRYGSLTFTMAGKKDYISEVSQVPLNKWTHVALAHSKVDNKLFFYINGELTEEVELLYEYETTDYNILIGSNLWEEFFDGYIANVKIWERELNAEEVQTIYREKEEGSTNKILWMLIPALLLVSFGLVYVLYLERKRKKKTFLKPKRRVKSTEERKVLINKNTKEGVESILCFGRLRIIDKEGNDVAEKLSPLLKKIFVIVFLYSYQGHKKGISTKQLTEFLWPGMSLQNAKNTRGTNINNLRTILNSCPGINLIFKNKFWYIDLAEACYCDFQIIQNKLESFSFEDYAINELEEELPDFLDILKDGRLFSRSSESWLDPFIEKFSNQIIEQCIAFTEILDVKEHSQLLLLLADVIHIYDDLNENAQKLKLQVLIHQGKLSLAHKTFDNYAKLYYEIYKENYAVSFEEMTSKANTTKKLKE